MRLAGPLLASFSVLAFAVAAHAQQQQSPPQPSQQSQEQSASGGASAGQKQPQGEMGVETLIGSKVSGKDGKELGEIEDVVLDLQGGRVHAVVLSFGGILGMGEKNFAFPISELKPGKQQGQFTMDVDKQKLDKAQGFAQGQWPEMDSEYWGKVGGQASAGATQQKGKTLVRASELQGKTVNDNQGQEVGDIKDVLVDVKSGELRNVVIDVQQGGQAQVPAQQLSAGTKDTYVVAMSAEEIKKQAKKSSGEPQSQSQQPQGEGASAGGGTAGQSQPGQSPSSGGTTTTPGSTQSQPAQPGGAAK